MPGKMQPDCILRCNSSINQNISSSIINIVKKKIIIIIEIRGGNCKIIKPVLRKSVYRIYLSGTIFPGQANTQCCPGQEDSP